MKLRSQSARTLLYEEVVEELYRLIDEKHIQPGGKLPPERELIEQLKKTYTIVIVTHSMQQASRVSDDTAFFLLGEIVETDKTLTIFSKPKDKRTEDYISGRFG